MLLPVAMNQESHHGCEFARGKDVSDLEELLWNKFEER